jgi:hypothetical protein
LLLHRLLGSLLLLLYGLLSLRLVLSLLSERIVRILRLVRILSRILHSVHDSVTSYKY